MMTFQSWEMDTFRLLVTWARPDGSPKDMTGAQVVAIARGFGGDHALIAGVSDGPAGKVLVSADPGTLLRGRYDLQLRVTVGGQTRTAEYALPVDASFQRAVEKGLNQKSVAAIYTVNHCNLRCHATKAVRRSRTIILQQPQSRAWESMGGAGARV